MNLTLSILQPDKRQTDPEIFVKACELIHGSGDAFVSKMHKPELGNKGAGMYAVVFYL